MGTVRVDEVLSSRTNTIPWCAHGSTRGIRKHSIGAINAKGLAGFRSVLALGARVAQLSAAVPGVVAGQARCAVSWVGRARCIQVVTLVARGAGLSAGALVLDAVRTL